MITGPLSFSVPRVLDPTTQTPWWSRLVVNCPASNFQIFVRQSATPCRCWQSGVTITSDPLSAMTILSISMLVVHSPAISHGRVPARRSHVIEIAFIGPVIPWIVSVGRVNIGNDTALRPLRRHQYLGSLVQQKDHIVSTLGK